MNVRKRVPSYRQHKPSGQAVVTIDSRDHYLGKFNSEASQEKYGRLIAECAVQYRTCRSSDDRTGDDSTIVELIAKYWDH